MHDARDKEVDKAGEVLWREVMAEMRITASMTGKAELSAGVLEALRYVPRHLFVPQQSLSNAYGNYPLSIGYGQTISQPYIVALMTELLECQLQFRVLEVGTGSGYQSAVLSRLVDKVFTIEIVAALGEQAQRRFTQLNLQNIVSRIGDDYHGWQEQAPFDGIIVTAAAPEIPPPLIQQLKPGGRLVIPVGSDFFGAQELVLVQKTLDGEVSERSVLPVAFVPLTGRHDPENGS